MADSSSSSTEIPQIKPGDEVEFQLSHNSRNGKISAIKIKRTSPSYSNGAYSNGSSGSSVNNNSSSSSSQQATTSNTTTSSNSSNSNNGGGESEKRERLNLKLKIANIDEKSGRELLLTRQPLNPDEHNKSKSFTRTLQKRSPGMLSGASSSSKSSLVSNSSSGALSSTTTTATSNNDNQQQQLHQSSSSVSILELLMNSDMSSLKQWMRFSLSLVSLYFVRLFLITHTHKIFTLIAIIRRKISTGWLWWRKEGGMFPFFFIKSKLKGSNSL